MEYGHNDTLEAMTERAWRITATKWIEGLTGLPHEEIWQTLNERTHWAISGAEREWERVVSESMPRTPTVNEPIENDGKEVEVMAIHYVYAIQAENGLVKIGTTASDPKARMKALQTGHPERLSLLCYFPGDHRVEAEIHQALSVARHHGEWFRGTKWVLGNLWLWHNQFWDIRPIYHVDD